MLNMSHADMQDVLRQLDQALYNHEQWHKELTRTLVCRLPYDHRDVAKDAHRECRFGQWYYLHAPPDLRSHTAFVAMEVAHKHMHELAAQLLESAAGNGSVPPRDFDNFANSLDRLRLEIHTLKRELEDALYNRDSLTGADSRIGMLTRLREALELVKRRVQHCCIAVMDLDHFKAVNDTYGHLAGDRALAAAVHYVMEHLRPYDRVFRYGGEEFLVAMQNTDLQTGHAVIDRLREGLAGVVLAHDGARPIVVTASFGITLLDPDVSVEESIDRADKAMYAAKTDGRNRTRVWDPSMTMGR